MPVEHSALKRTLLRWLCRLGVHKYRVVDVQFGFSSGGGVERRVCERCGTTCVRNL